MPTTDDAHAHFWTLAEPWLTKPDVAKATMMGFPCLRRNGVFFVSIEHKGDGLIIKLPKTRVIEALINEEGEPFAPNGRVFKEWLRVPYALHPTWPNLMAEAYDFAQK